LTVLRGKERLERDMELVAELQPFAHPTLGLLPLRDEAADASGIGVRYVDRDGPADKAGVRAGDRLVRFAGQPARDRQDLVSRLAEMEPGDSVPLEIQRDGKSVSLTVVLGRLPEELPLADLPAAAPAAEKPVPGATVKLKIPELPHEMWAYVPERASADTACGVLVYLHGARPAERAKLLAQWKKLCDRCGLILAVPQAADKKQWQPTELAVVSKLLSYLEGKYTLDPARVALLGDGPGATLAMVASLRLRERIRGVVLLGASVALNPLENDPAYRQSYLFLRPTPAAKRTIEALRKKKFPVTVKDLPAAGQTITAGELPDALRSGEAAEIARWIDMLDRI
jgi:pimeloyl-ACP methyl ester carboxylesterase